MSCHYSECKWDVMSLSLHPSACQDILICVTPETVRKILHTYTIGIPCVMMNTLDFGTYKCINLHIRKNFILQVLNVGKFKCITLHLLSKDILKFFFIKLIIITGGLIIYSWQDFRQHNQVLFFIKGSSQSWI